MYDFVDRPLASLDPGGRLLIWAMRFWVRGAVAGRCPCGDVAPAFAKRDLNHAFPHFHGMMAVLNRGALLKLQFGSVMCDRVCEPEALILTVLRDVHVAGLARGRATAALLVQPQSVTILTSALSALAARLADAGLLPQAPTVDATDGAR